MNAGDAAFAGATAADPSKFPGMVTAIGFNSPSGNIGCGFWDGGAIVCQIQKFTYTPSPAGDCHGAGFWGNAVRMQGGDTVFICAGDVESGGPTLAYGQQLTVGSLRCVSRQEGVTCENTTTGRGFRLATATFTFFAPADAGAKASVTVPAALVGNWGGHGAGTTISASGVGHLDYRTYQFCSDNPTPPCDPMQGNEIIDGGHITFTLTAAVSKSAASGKITASNDPKYAVGTPVTATASGYNLTLSIWPGIPFCAPNTPQDKWNCGA